MFIVGIACFQWRLWLFIIGNICTKSTQSTLLNIFQLYIPTNQLAQPHSQSLNKFCISAKELAHPPAPDAIRSIARPCLKEIEPKGFVEGGWGGR